MDNPLSLSLYNRNELLTFEPKLPWVGPFFETELLVKQSGVTAFPASGYVIYQHTY